MKDRLSRLRAGFESAAIDALLVTDDINVSYLTKTPAHDAWLLVTPKKAFYITDFRYITQMSFALKASPFKLVQFKDSIIQAALDLASGEGVKSLGFDANKLTVHQHGRLSVLLPKAMKVMPLESPVELVRMVKEPEELELIRASLKLNLEMFRWIEPRLKAGVSERAIVGLLEGFIRRHQVSFAFPPIVASGPNAAMPHASVTERKLRAGEAVLLDLGIEKDRYKSDLTRMFFLGRMAPSYKEALGAVQEAQQAAISIIRPGMNARDVDAKARQSLKKHKLAQYFGHSLGHGVGLETHEMPRLSSRSGAILTENMVVTVEPGVYIPGRFGIRLEEMIVVTKQGCEVLK